MDMVVNSNATSSDESDISLGNPAKSTKEFRQRMLPCEQSVWERENCPCCGRNFKKARAAIGKFRDSISAAAVGEDKKLAQALNFNEQEAQALLTESFLCRLLARCGCNFKQAQDRLIVALALHRKFSLQQSQSCSVCRDNPGFHSFRQVGFDRLGRPILYTCLNQDQETGTQPHQVKDYFLHLFSTVIEAEKTIPEDQHSLIMIFDTNGLSMAHIRSDTVSQFGDMLRYFPARLCYAMLLNLSTMTRFLLKPVIHLTGHQMDILALSNKDIDKQLAECFDAPMVRWVVREMEQNKRSKVPFYLVPNTQSPADDHDPRGESSYIAKYVCKLHPSGHRPHASIVVAMNSKSSSKSLD